MKVRDTIKRNNKNFTLIAKITDIFLAVSEDGFEIIRVPNIERIK